MIPGHHLGARETEARPPEDRHYWDVDDGPKPTVEELKSQEWRLNNLYYVMAEDGTKTPFRMNWAQKMLFHGMWYLNIILKARQLGFSTFVMIYMLDNAMWRENIRCGVIAHNRDDAEYLFRDKIKYAYDNLPASLQAFCTAETISKSELLFSNNSSIRVSTSFRGGTMQILHVSEFGKISRKYPEKAREIVSGAFNAVHLGNKIFVESTAEGKDGEFHRMCQDAMKTQQQSKHLTQLDFKFWFFPWFKDYRYQIDPTNVVIFYQIDPTNVVIFPRLHEYFRKLELDEGIRLTTSQKAWYALKSRTMGELMWREFPATVKEAFDAKISGSYFANEMEQLRKTGRIMQVRHDPVYPVDSWWDLGMHDPTGIWFTQTVGREIRVLRYYENCGYGLKHYVDYLAQLKDDYGYSYGRHVAPHDIEVRELGTGTSRLETALGLGLGFEVCPKLPKTDQIEAARNMFARCVFDESDTERGIDHLDNYRMEWDDKYGAWKDKPFHGPESNAADAFQIFGVAHYFEAVTEDVRRPAKNWKVG
jgi:hypothetical protein